MNTPQEQPPVFTVPDIPFIALCIPCLIALACGLRLGQKKKGRNLQAAGLMGLGFGKILLLALPLTHVLEICLHAHPLARSGWSAWFAILAAGSQLVLLTSGAADIIRALGIWFGGFPPEMVRAPFASDTMTTMWRRFSHPLSPRAGPWAGLAVYLSMAIAIHGFTLGIVAWLALQCAFIGLERLKGVRSLLPALVPQPLRAAFVMVVFFLSHTLLLSRNTVEFGQTWRLMFGAGEPQSFTYLLDARLSGAWPLWLLWVSVFSALLLTGLRRIASRHRVFSLVSGLSFGFVAVFAGPVLLDAPALDFQKKLTAKLLYRSFQQGSSRVIAGRDGWLYGAAEMDRITHTQTADRHGTFALSLHAYLAEKKASLLLIPVPGKFALNPEPFLPAKYAAPFQPHGLRTTLERLRAAGVHILDPAQMLWDKRMRLSSYFRQDSHWTPEAMKETALLTAKHIRQHWPRLASDETPMINVTLLDREDIGDLARALAAESTGLFEPEACTLLSFQGLPPDHTSPVLLVGGSLLKVFDDPSLSHGNEQGKAQNAGFAAQLAALLARPLHVADEAELLQGNVSLQDKSLVIWLLPAWRL